MRRTIQVVLAIVLWCCLPGTALAGGTADRLLKQGDELYGKREQAGMAEQAMGAYEQVLAIDDANVAAYWKIARSYWWMAGHTDGDDKKAELYREGIEFAKLAVEVDAESAAAHFWLGLLYGSFGEVKGIMQSLSLIDPMMQELEIARKLDETFEWGGADRVLCRLYVKLPGVKGGDVNKAIEHGRKAVALAPEMPMNHLFLAEALLADDQDDEARKVLQHVVEMPALPERVPESQEDKATAAKHLEDL